MVECVIFAGGLGTRLRPAVADLPKSLAPINGVAFLDLLLSQIMRNKNVTKVVLALGYKASQIIEHYKKHDFPFSLEFSLEASPLGTGGALKKSMEIIHSEHVFVLNGDSLLDFSFSDFWNFHLQSSSDVTIASVFTEKANRYGLLEICNETSRILAFHEKPFDPVNGWINAGVYLIRKNFLDDCIHEEAFSLEQDIFPQCINKKMHAYLCKGLFIDIGTPESFLLTQQLLNR